MKIRTIRQTVSFKASPKDVYDTIMDSKRHQSLSGERAAISKRVGAAFTAWDSHISGFNLALRPGSRIVQAWRATGWPPDHYSIAIFDIVKTAGGRKLTFTQIGVRPDRYSGHYRGWIEPTGRQCRKSLPREPSATGRGKESEPTRHSASARASSEGSCRGRLKQVKTCSQPKQSSALNTCGPSRCRDGILLSVWQSRRFLESFSM